MTELMLRLIKDKKIVGYEWHRKVAPDAELTTIWYREVEDDAWHFTGDQAIDYDSFDPGIKVGEEWFFSGDIFEAPPAEDLKEKRIIILRYGENNQHDDIVCGWYWELVSGHAENLDGSKTQYIWKSEITRAKRIGTVYDEGGK